MDTFTFDPAGALDQALIALVDAIGTANLPARRYTWVGGELNTDMLTGDAFIVHGARFYPGDPGPEEAGAASTLEGDIWSVEFGATIVRCIPLDEVPDAATLNQTGQTSLNDGEILRRGVNVALAKGTLSDGWQRSVVGPITWESPEGGMVASTVTINMGLEPA